MRDRIGKALFGAFCQFLGVLLLIIAAKTILLALTKAVELEWPDGLLAAGAMLATVGAAFAFRGLIDMCEAFSWRGHGRPPYHYRDER